MWLGIAESAHTSSGIPVSNPVIYLHSLIFKGKVIGSLILSLKRFKNIIYPSRVGPQSPLEIFFTYLMNSEKPRGFSVFVKDQFILVSVLPPTRIEFPQ